MTDVQHDTLNYPFIKKFFFSLVLGCFLLAWQSTSLGAIKISDCENSGGKSLSKKWSWHYPKETPSIKNGSKSLTCANKKKGLLYTRSDIEGKYFVANKQWVKSTPIVGSVCEAIQYYCNPEEAKKTESGPVEMTSVWGSDWLLPEKVYSRDELLLLAINPDEEPTKTFASIGWFQGASLTTLDQLPEGQNTATRIKLLGFNKTDSELRIAHNIQYKHQSNQVMVATWDLASKSLQQLVVLQPGSELVTANKHIVVVSVDKALMMFDSETGELLHTLLEESRSPSVRFSSDGHYVSVSDANIVKNADGSFDKFFSEVFVQVFDVATGETLLRKSSSIETKNAVALTFSPDSNLFVLSWSCFGCENDDYLYELGTVDTWKLQEIPALGTFGDPVFSADGQYIVARSFYDVLGKTGKSDFVQCSGGLGVPVPKNLLNISFVDDTLKYNQVIDGGCVTVSQFDWPKNIATHWQDSFFLQRHLFSTNYQQIAVPIQNETGIANRLHIFDSQLPTDSEIVRSVQRKEKEVALKRGIAQAEKMREVGFTEEALIIMNDLIEQNAEDPMAGRSLLAHLLSWRYTLPLAELGKPLLRHKELVLAQPHVVAAGFWGESNKAGAGYVIGGIYQDSNADRAGLEKGDIVLAINGKSVVDKEGFETLLNTFRPDVTIELAVRRNGTSVTIPLALEASVRGGVWAVVDLAEYGAIAAAAGHPDLTLAAASELRTLLEKYRSSMDKEGLNNFAIMLESLSMAARGDHDGAYKYALKNGGFANKVTVVKTFFFNAGSDTSDFVTPLYQSRLKLAYMLDIDVSELMETPKATFGFQAYPDLSGNVISSKDKASVNQGFESIEENLRPKPKPKSKPGIQLLD